MIEDVIHAFHLYAAMVNSHVAWDWILPGEENARAIIKFYTISQNGAYHNHVTVSCKDGELTVKYAASPQAVASFELADPQCFELAAAEVRRQLSAWSECHGVVNKGWTDFRNHRSSSC